MSEHDIQATETWTPSHQLKNLLKPFVDMDRVGYEGFEQWLTTILSFLEEFETKSGNPTDAVKVRERRILHLARSLSESASARSREHFLAAEYFMDNTRLTRRMKALEAAIRTSQRTGKVPNIIVPEESDTRDERYLSGKGDP